MAIIRIKRSTATSAPGSLKTAEIAYSMGTGTQANGGDRLYFGKGDDGSGNATSIVVIGGEYFANLLDHAAGTLTANSAIIVDGDSKIDNLKVDNIDINGNTISSTNTNGNIVLDPNGSGVIDASTSRITNVTNPTGPQDAATKSYVDTQRDAATLGIAADGATAASINISDSDLTIAGGTGLTSTASGTTVTLSLDNTTVNAGSYGSATQIPTFTVDQQGRLTAAGQAAVATTLNTIAETGNGSVSLIDSSLTIAAGEGINTVASGATITISGEDAAAGSGSANKGIASFDTSNFAVSSGHVTIKDGGIANAELAGSITNDKLVNNTITINSKTISLGDSDTLTTSDIAEGTNLYYTTARADSDAKNAISGGTGVTYSATTGVIAIGQSVATNADVVFSSVTTTNGLVVEGNLQVNGTTTTVNSQTLEVTDNMIYMNAAESDGSPTQFVDVGWAANVNDTGTYAHVGMFRDATDGVFKLYQGYTPEPDSDVQINTGHPSFAFAPLRVSSITGVYVGFDSDFAAKTTDNLTEGSNLYYTDERVDDRIANLLLAGEGIDLTYVDNGSSPGTLTVAAELATISNPGVASFDSNEFDVISGAVKLDTIDGGTF